MYHDRDLNPDTLYYYRIQTYNDGGYSGYSNEATAKTQKTYTLTIGVNQAGYGTTNPPAGSYSYDEGAVVSVTATPASGCQFVGWTGNVADAGKPSTTVTVNENMTVTANFEKPLAILSLKIPLTTQYGIGSLDSGTLYVLGEILNSGTIGATSVSMTLIARNASGTYIDELTESIGTIPANSSKGFEVSVSNIRRHNPESIDYTLTCNEGGPFTGSVAVQ